jgi:hypothetical protein
MSIKTGTILETVDISIQWIVWIISIDGFNLGLPSPGRARPAATTRSEVQHANVADCPAGGRRARHVPGLYVISMQMPTMTVPQGMCAQDIRSAQLRMGGSHVFAAGHGLLTQDQRERRRARIAESTICLTLRTGAHQKDAPSTGTMFPLPAVLSPA